MKHNVVQFDNYTPAFTILWCTWLKKKKQKTYSNVSEPGEANCWASWVDTGDIILPDTGQKGLKSWKIPLAPLLVCTA